MSSDLINIEPLTGIIIKEAKETDIPKEDDAVVETTSDNKDETPKGDVVVESSTDQAKDDSSKYIYKIYHRPVRFHSL